ncbi:regulator of telomere elongation helicase 1 homolog [Anopheles nili]|uniref:regulator of telomere elongation helicase 1 homolog n=1 Tax=Anopheles nili TaxID=185578 RepID=UPI00237B8F35|nr:regulator of telomere elongation helicase 1 homolog [Anopheles nili]
MPEYVINGVPVSFPFEPYEVQTNYMAKVIESLQKGTNCVLESPTGTGKTLSLLCSSLGWLLHTRSKVTYTDGKIMKIQMELSNYKLADRITAEIAGKLEEKRTGVQNIIYASRTHSQLSQAMQELKNTHYNFVRSIILGSRDQLCIHPDVSKVDSNAMKTNLCREKVKSRNCSFYTRVENVKDRSEIAQKPVLDIEDLITVGTKLKACPYYLSKTLVERADVLFMPYNYLLDAKAHKSNGLLLTNSIVILDEAHNVEKMCEESGSADLRSSDIALAIEDVTSVIKKLQENEGIASFDEDEKMEFTVDDLVLLKEILLNLEKAVDEIPSTFSQGGQSFPGTYIFDLFKKANITTTNIMALLKVLNSVTEYITTMREKNHYFRNGVGLQCMADFLEIVFCDSGPEYHQSIEKCFKTYIEAEEVKPTKGSQKRTDGWIDPKKTTTAKVNANAKVIHFWCFNPGFGMRRLLGRGIRSIILTSGTLAPLKPLISELGIPIDVCLENPHIISQNQVYVKVVSHGPDKFELNSSYSTRNNPQYIASLGRTVLSLSPIIPGGMLVFFPSYHVMNKCVEDWQTGGIWAQINRVKPVFTEPRTKASFSSTMNDYYARLNDPGSKGAIFMAVCRGKVSEGLDFADANGRAVLITGLPFPPLLDARVKLKKQYLDSNRTRENELITGDYWYSLEASRAVNQAIGRVIRHKDDYGAILLCDSRFQNPRQKSQLSTWIQSHVQDTRSSFSFGTVAFGLGQFFRNLEKSPLVAKPREVCVKPEPLDAEAAEERVVKYASHLAITSNGEGIKKEIMSQTPFALSDYLQKPAGTDSVVNTNGESGSFLAQLSCGTSTLNIGDAMAYSSSSAPIPGLVTLHKRERNASTDGVSVKEIKKRKLVLVPADPVKYEHPSGAPNRTHAFVKAEPSDGDKLDTSDNFSKAELPKAPENRVHFLMAVKSALDKNKYKEFLLAMNQYSKVGDFQSFMEKITFCFSDAHLLHLLQAIRRFVKNEHKHLFDEQMNKKGL